MIFLLGLFQLLSTGALGQAKGGTPVDKTTNYKKQIIGVLGDDRQVNEAAKYLYEKHPEVSDVVKWDPTDKKFKLAKWNDKIWGYEFYPKDANGKEKDIPPLPDERSRVQVVGYGEIQQNKVTLGGLLPNELAEGLKGLPGVEKAGEITRVSLVGCNVGKLKDSGQEFVGNEYPKTLLETLKADGIATEVSSRVGIVGVDSTGRKVVGKLLPDGRVAWRVGEGNLKKTVVRYEGSDIEIIKTPITSGDNFQTPLSMKYKTAAERQSLLTKVKSLDKFAHIITDETGDEQFFFDSDALFDILSDAMREVFDDITIPANWPDDIISERIVQQGDKIRKEKVVKKGEEVKLEVREPRNILDLMIDIKYFGERGFRCPSSTDTLDPKDKVFKDPQGIPYENKLTYYRFGDWVVNLKYEASRISRFGMNPFYAELEGIIRAEDPSNPTQTKNENEKIPEVKKHYNDLLPKTNDDFFPEAQKWMKGNNDQITVSEAGASNAVASTAIFLSESIRDWRSWPTNKMALDLYNHGAMSRNKFFEAHPMVRAGVAPYKWTGTRDELWEGRVESGPEKNWNEYPQGVFLKKRFGRMLSEWLTPFDIKTDDGMKLKGTSLKRTLDDNDVDTGPAAKRQRIIEKVKESVKEVATMQPDSGSEYLNIEPGKTIAGPLGDGPWDARPVQIPELETAQSEVDDYDNSEDRSMSGRASEAIDRDQIYISKQIDKALEAQGKGYEVDEKSVKIENNRVKFISYDPEDPSIREPLEEELDESKISSKEILNEMKAKGNDPTVAHRVDRVQSIYGTILGIQATIRLFKEGDIKNGAIVLLQTAHGLGELTGFNKKVSEAASRTLGSYLNDDALEVREIGDNIVQGEGARMLAGDAEELGALGTDAAKASEDIPIIGTLFGVYNIRQDLKQHTVIGYVDAGLDSLLTFAGLFGPEAEPVVVVLTAIRMTIDTFYNDVKKELDALPPDATVGNKVKAAFKGIGKSLLDIADFLTGGIFSAPAKAHDLDKQYEKDQEFLRNLSDYNNYYTIAAGPDSSTINFASGEVSWNGGDIVFVLYNDHTAQLNMTMTDENGQEVRHVETLHFGQDVKDIVMGIGEAHSVHFTEEKVKVMWFIPVDKKAIIDGLQPDQSTIHGTYIGNYEDNNFYAVQELPLGTDLGYSLEDYHYVLIGGEGDDSFYLGPQHNYVEGNDGTDAYFINYTFTVINNFAWDGADDYLNINRPYASLYLQRMDYDLNVSSIHVHNPLSVIIKNWFRSDAYQHMHFKSSDGFLFTASLQKDGAILTLPYALIAPNDTQGVDWDSTYLNLTYVQFLSGSPFADRLVGNALDNTIKYVGYSGVDTFSGQNGTDTYDLTDQSVTGKGSQVKITNYAEDMQNDIIYLPVNSAHSSLQRQGDNLLILYSGQTKVTLLSWFNFPYVRHLLAITNDSDVYTIQQSPSGQPKAYPIILTLNSATVLNLSVYDSYADVSQISVIGSPYNDQIFGHVTQDYIKGGKGYDVISGGEGQDVYVMHPGDGMDFINNFANDREQDLLLLGTEYDDLYLRPELKDVTIASHAHPHGLQVTLVNWTIDPSYQHLQVQTIDGINFEINATRHTANKVPVAMDKSGSKAEIYLDLNTKEWRNVERVIGSPFTDSVWGSDLDNYFDLREGGDYVAGRNGSDTYVYDLGYGVLYIDNVADDNVTDSLMIMVPFEGISVNKVHQGHDLVLNVSNSTGPLDIIFLINFLTDNRTHHLQVTSSDGFIFVLPPSNNYEPIIVGINKVQDKTGQFVNLTTSNYSRVILDNGANNFTNYIVGNDMNNTLVGGIEDDYLYGGPGNDVLKGKAGNNTLHGGDGNDILIGGAHTDIMDGGSGDDSFFPGLGSNKVSGGDGDDTIYYMGDPISEEGVYINLNDGDVNHTYGLDSVEGMENVYGTPYNDIIITAGFLDNVILGLNGNDTLVGLGGYDNLIGGEGNDTYDLSQAIGTMVIDNYAKDGIMDTIIFPYESRRIRFERQELSLVLHIVSTRFYPNNNTEPFNACNGQDPPMEVDLYPPVNTNCTGTFSDLKLNEALEEEMPVKFDLEETVTAPPISGPSTNSPATSPPTTSPPTTNPPATSPPASSPPTTSQPTTSPPTTNPPPSAGDYVPFCEVYDSDSPTLILKNWFYGPVSQHIQIHLLDCVIGMDYLAKMPIIINCIQDFC